MSEERNDEDRQIGVTRLTGAEQMQKASNGRPELLLLQKERKIAFLKRFAGHQKPFTSVAEAACGKHLSLNVCSTPVDLVP